MHPFSGHISCRQTTTGLYHGMSQCLIIFHSDEKLGKSLFLDFYRKGPRVSREDSGVHALLLGTKADRCTCVPGFLCSSSTLEPISLLNHRKYTVPFFPRSTSPPRSVKLKPRTSVLVAGLRCFLFSIRKLPAIPSQYSGAAARCKQIIQIVYS